MPSPAVLFDLDGTLVDTTVLHTLAWWRALDEADEHAPMSAVQPLIGLSGPSLLERLIGRDDPHIRDRHGEYFAEAHPLVRPLPGAADLLRRVHDLGGTVVVVTSARDRDLDALLGPIESRDVIAEIVNHEPSAAGKPAPDLVTMALERVGCGPADALFIGDSVWDVEAARRAGVGAIGVETGGTSPERLTVAGAVAVYSTCREMLDLWPVTPLATLLGVATGRFGGSQVSQGAVAEPDVTSGSHAPDVTQQLLAEHTRIRRLLDELIGRDTKARREGLDHLAEMISRHEAAEEAAVYPVLAHAPFGRELRRVALGQERDLSRALRRALRHHLLLREAAARRALRDLQRGLDEHLAYEEQRIFPVIQAAEDPSKRQMMGAWACHAERLAPTRPHPHAPRKLPGLVATGPALAVSDRLRQKARRGLSRSA
jgi:HAD superfamily hydrolase (TIGR01509 family)